MHRCYPGCRPDVGFHVSHSSSEPEEEQWGNFVDRVNGSGPKSRSMSSNQFVAPNPDNYHIKDVKEYGHYKVILVHYPNCTNFKGMKVLVAECSMLDLVKLTRLDPHFTEVIPKDGIKILGRFPPNQEGIELANQLAKLLSTK